MCVAEMVCKICRTDKPLSFARKTRKFISTVNQLDAPVYQIYFILEMFQTVFPSIIRCSRLYIQQQVYVKQILLNPLASGQQYLFDKCLLLYVQS